MTKVLFLDVDGVLNHRQAFVEQRGNGFRVLCPTCCTRLRQLVAETGARVVLSSTWQSSPSLVAFLRSNKILDSAHEDWSTRSFGGRAMGTSTYTQHRGTEINDWLLAHPEITTYAIVDDCGDMLPDQMARFVRTSFEFGLTEVDRERLRTLLGGPAS